MLDAVAFLGCRSDFFFWRASLIGVSVLPFSLCVCPPVFAFVFFSCDSLSLISSFLSLSLSPPSWWLLFLERFSGCVLVSHGDAREGGGGRRSVRPSSRVSAWPPSSVLVGSLPPGLFALPSLCPSSFSSSPPTGWFPAACGGSDGTHTAAELLGA